MSAPASAQASTCATVALTSVVSVLVIVCTLIGASPPTGTGADVDPPRPAPVDVPPGADGIVRHGFGIPRLWACGQQ